MVNRLRHKLTWSKTPGELTIEDLQDGCCGSIRINAWEELSLWGGAKVSCILRHRGVQLILAYSWARPAILVAGKGGWGIFLFLLFLHLHSCSFLPCPSL